MKSRKIVIFFYFFYAIERSKTSLRFNFFSSFALPIKHINSSFERVIVPLSLALGQRKRPRSSRLKYSQKPSISHSNILMRFRCRLQNTNSASANGSIGKSLCTIVINPLILFLISVCPQQRYTGLSPKLSIVILTPDIPFPDVRDLFPVQLWFEIRQSR